MFKCPNEHHACICQKTVVLVYCFLTNLTETEALRKENERNTQTLKKLNDYIKDVNQNLHEQSYEIERVHEKVDQTMSVVQKQTVVLQNNNTIFKENMPMFLKFKEILDEHERDLTGKQIDGYNNTLEEKDREIVGLKENTKKLEEKHQDELKESKNKYKELKKTNGQLIQEKEALILDLQMKKIG